MVGCPVEQKEVAKALKERKVVALECPGALVPGPSLTSHRQTAKFISKAELRELSTILLATQSSPSGSKTQSVVQRTLGFP